MVAFNRVSANRPIRNRAGIQTPDVVIVLDPNLLRVVKVTAGLKDDGVVVINTKQTMEEVKAQLGSKWRLATVDAARIAKEVLGVPIVNTSMIGALLKASRVIEPESFLEPLKHRFGRLGERNFEALKKAYDETTVDGTLNRTVMDSNTSPKKD